MLNTTAATVPLIAGSNWGNSIWVEGFSRAPDQTTHSMFNAVGPGFFSKMGVPLVRGREFGEQDTAASPRVAVVNETFARHFFGGGDPVGKHFDLSGEKTLGIQIVGVVKDTKYSSVRQTAPRVYYIPYRQSKDTGAIQMYVRTGLAPELVVPQIRRVMRELDPDLPLESLRTLREQVRRNIRNDRLVLQLASAFAILAFAKGLLILSAFCAVIVGALLGFLWFNIFPAHFIMGDTGAISLGATLGVIALMTDSVAVLPIIGFVFVIETLSVIIQLTSKKLFKRKVFKIAPLHHHFEKSGWSEPNIVMRFWIIGSFSATLGLILGLLAIGV